MTDTDISSAAHLKPSLLAPESLSLNGCHLIEASAGTGKTYNITRIYLRLLIERRLDVRNILVMTFTRAATEELRGRIAREIRDALQNWEQLIQADQFFAALGRQYTLNDVYPALHNALLHLDEAAIFTIHSFCKRVLSQQAFSSGVAFNVQMEADTAEIELQAVRDWYRVLARDKIQYQQLSQRWSTPELFHRAFAELLSATTPVMTMKPEQLQADFQARKAQALEHIQHARTLIFSVLIEPHKQAEKRAGEWQILIDWLSTDYFTAQVSQDMPKAASDVFHGGRFPKKDPELKQQLVAVFAPLKALKAAAADIEKTIADAHSYQLAASGIEIIRKKIAQAKQQSKVMNYDDLINQLAAVLTAEQQQGTDSSLAELIRTQYPAALVDEFQDTDPNQYAILKAIYLNGKVANETDSSATALYMIGDPKQAIYAFRSGDVFTYLAARDDADQQWLMDTNWRSTRAMVNAYNRLFYGAPLNAPPQDVFGFNIHYTPVKSAGLADKKSLNIITDSQQQQDAALHFAYFPFNEDYRAGRSSREEMNQDFCPVIASWCSHEIHHLLDPQNGIAEQPLQEQDIAVLVRDKKEAAYIQDALQQAGYASVYLSTHDNVFLSAEAAELEQVLAGILELENDRLLIAALATRFLGCDTQQLFALQEDEAQWERHRDTLLQLRESWLKQGFMAMALKLLHHNYTPHPEQHERALTNAVQLLELLQQASQRHRQPEQLLNWLREQISAQGSSAEAELRLESDANLIRIITQHGSKGLEYPVVFIPFATRYKDPARFGNKNIDLYKYHEPDDAGNKGQLKYFIGQDQSIKTLYQQEAWAETIRLLYVAVTRAQYRCYIGAAAFANYHQSPLGQTLKINADNDLLQLLNILAEPQSDTAESGIYIQQIEGTDFPVVARKINVESQSICAAQFNGRIERNWWLSSFSALTRNLRHGGISTPDRDQNELVSDTENKVPAVHAIRFKLTRGAAAGNLLHDILEHTDFTEPHWQRSMERPLARFNESPDTAQQAEISLWLEDCLATSLQISPDLPAEQTVQLNQLNWSDTLRETEFYFPMEQVKPQQLGKILAEHRQQQTRIQLPGKNVLQGMMHGFVDLIFHWQGKYYIADYKSTHLGNSLDDYQYTALAKNIRDNYYDLQYLLYSLALHRYLKTRLENYQPEQHFGGIHYLYLRGMTAGKTNGVYSTAISPELLNKLDSLFASTEINSK